MKPLQWFTDRIGKRVFRPDHGCSCSSCRRIAEEGIIIEDEEHAQYLYDWDDYRSEDGTVHIVYADTKEEL